MALTDYSYLDSADASLREFPTHILPSKVSVTIEQPTMTSTTNSLTTQRRSLGAHRISLEYTYPCLLYTSPSPRDGLLSRMPSSA